MPICHANTKRKTLRERLHNQAKTATGWWVEDDIHMQILAIKSLLRGTGFRLVVSPTPHPHLEVTNPQGRFISSFNPHDVYLAIF